MATNSRKTTDSTVIFEVEFTAVQILNVPRLTISWEVACKLHVLGKMPQKEATGYFFIT